MNVEAISVNEEVRTVSSEAEREVHYLIIKNIKFTYDLARTEEVQKLGTEQYILSIGRLSLKVRLKSQRTTVSQLGYQQRLEKEPFIN